MAQQRRNTLLVPSRASWAERTPFTTPARFILEPQLDQTLWVSGLQVVDERLDFFCTLPGVLRSPLGDDVDAVAERCTSGAAGNSNPS
ncbi:hypothetical protein ACVWZX_003126 [Deinococcus sp. UYEF24]